MKKIYNANLRSLSLTSDENPSDRERVAGEKVLEYLFSVMPVENKAMLQEKSAIISS